MTLKKHPYVSYGCFFYKFNEISLKIQFVMVILEIPEQDTVFCECNGISSVNGYKDIRTASVPEKLKLSIQADNGILGMDQPIFPKGIDSQAASGTIDDLLLKNLPFRK